MERKPTTIAINGFGRIGRALLRALRGNETVSVVHINDPMERQEAAYLLTYDSLMSRYPGTVEECAGGIRINGEIIRMTHDRDITGFDWRDLGIDFIVNSSGVNNQRGILEQYLEQGAARVFISAPAPQTAHRHVLMGVNEGDLTGDDRIISGGSCTAHCFAPIVQTLADRYTIERGFMQTVHAYTSSQNLMDGPHPSDPRRGRAAGVNIVPTTTESIGAFEMALPRFTGLLRGMAMRVPVAGGSNVDLVLQFGQTISRDEINDCIREAAAGSLQNIVEFSDAPLVSSDILGNPHSCVFDSLLTDCHGPLVRLFLWYDNEWGYTRRFVELLEYASGIGQPE